MKSCKKFVITSILFWILSGVALACVQPPPPPPSMPTAPPPIPEVWMIDHGTDPITGLNNMWFGVEVNPVLFSTSTPTICTCAIGLGGVGLPFVPSLNVTSAMLGVTDMVTHDIEPVVEFDFLPDGTVTADASAKAMLPGQQWSGFSATVSNVVQPIFGPNEILKLWFNIETDVADAELLRQATASTFLGFSVGGDPQNLLHPPLQFIGHKVPEPVSYALFAIGLMLLIKSRVTKP